MSTLSDRLIADHDPEAELARREAYLAHRRATMPGLVAHQEALARGEDIATILRRTAARSHVRRGPAPVGPSD